MNKAKETLEEYRKRRKVDEAAKLEESTASTSTFVPSRISPPSPSFISRLLSIDVLDSLPFRLWREAYYRNPTVTLIGSFIVYLLGQVLFVWIEFGLVFFILSVLMTICLSLGKRNEGEISAYSVFNKNCERLLGQMTAEHFERDVLRRRVQ